MSITSFDYLLFIGGLFLLIAATALREGHIPAALRPYLTPLRPINLILLIASYAFYALFDTSFPVILFGITCIVYVCGLRGGRWWIRLGIIACLGTLGLFKYYAFFVESFGGSPALHLILPIGLSFYSFQAISYLLDVNSGVTAPTRNFISFALYMAFFPRLLQGPIERAKPFLAQIESERQITWDRVEQGTFLILQGAFKKLGVANIIGLAIHDYYDQRQYITGQPSGLLWGVMLLYTLQIYFDFAGYMDIAIGTGKLFGFELSSNFALPYFSPRPVDFWNRWHITLSMWLRDYLFMPITRFLLRRSRRRTLIIAIAYMITMTLSGLWHGAGWNFVLWGALHGVLLIGSRLLLPTLRPLKSLPDYTLRLLQIAVTFLLINITFVFFALPVSNAVDFLYTMFSFKGGGISVLQTPLIFALAMWLIFDLGELLIDTNKLALMRLPSPLRGGIYALMVAGCLVSGLSYVQHFVYEVF